jgi:carbon-monoxide dehydrogenase iron sulfur subunit
MKRVYSKEEVCMGCRLCEIYCTVEHSQTKDIIKAFKFEKPKPKPHVLVEEEGGISFALQCRHCDKPACVEACVTGAMTKAEDGKVLYNEQKCVGCWTCVMVCPFGALRRDVEAKKVIKCDLCPQLEIPACVANCPNRALVYEER